VGAVALLQKHAGIPGMAEKDSEGRAYLKWAGLGFEFAAVVGLFVYFGYLADQRWGYGPWGLVIGGAIGFTGGLYHLVKEGFAMNREFDSTGRDGAGDGDEDEDGPSEPKG
jgi:F0F1-type ATP synthase assembly protein I